MEMPIIRANLVVLSCIYAILDRVSSRTGKIFNSRQAASSSGINACRCNEKQAENNRENVQSFRVFHQPTLSLSLFMKMQVKRAVL